MTCERVERIKTRVPDPNAETYEQVHLRIRRERGPARDYPCAHGCGKAAAHWAYGHTDPDVPPGLLSPYSTNIDHYLPLCAKCHTAFDSEQIEVEKSCPQCRNVFRGHASRVYCSTECRKLAADRRRGVK